MAELTRASPACIGVTGNIACGKSAVLDMLAELGAETIDADRVYHQLVAPGAPLLATIRERFGPAIVAPDGGLDRARLGAIVFSDPAALAALDTLVRTPVRAEIRRRVAASHAEVVAVDAIKLIESGIAADCDAVWAVTCAPEVQLRRLMARSGLDETEARRRITAQSPPEAKILVADTVIDNSGALAETRRQVAFAYAAFRERMRPGRKDAR
ncbi:MAG: dephospho-CoA kinase [Thermomicrobiales bacterium]|nr:dephospho-CoA kinase [Thermomicrobiales bacterium]